VKRRPAVGPVFFGHENQALAGYSRALATPASNGDVLFGTVDSWLIWRLTGAGARHRLQQRQPHTRLQHPHVGLGRRVAPPARHSAGHAARGAIVERGLRPHGQGLFGGAIAIAGTSAISRRPPSSGLFCVGQRQEHVRHRLFSADEYRRKGRAVAEQFADHDRLGLDRR